MTTTKTERNEIAPLVKAELFTVSKKTKTMSIEASEFRLDFLRSQVYADAADSGFRVVNEKTGQSALFVFEKPDVYGDEITGWYFTPTTQSVNQNPRLVGWKILIIND